MIGRSVSISLAMKSKKAETRGVCRNSLVVNKRQMRVSSATGSITRTRSGSLLGACSTPPMMMKDARRATP